MKTTIVKTDVWKDDELFSLHLDSKLLYLFILTSPDRGCITVFKWSKRVASFYTGVNESQIETALKELKEQGFVDVYKGYVGILKEHLGKNGYRWNETNAVKEWADIPQDVVAHFEGKPKPKRVENEKPVKKAEPKETAKTIIAAQPEALRQPLLDFMADRLERKKPATTGAVKRWISKLESMYPKDIARQVESVEQSIERGWSGMYPVKENNRDPEKREFM